MLLIGSRALVFRAPQLLSKPPKDFDFIAFEEEALEWLEQQNITEYKYQDGKILVNQETPCEFELADHKPSSQMLIEIVKKDPQTISTSFGLVPNFNLLFTLKSSHKYLKNSPFFWKTRLDYHKMKEAGGTILSEYQEFFKLREKETYTYTHPKLNVSKDNFFKDDNIVYLWDHDDVHKSICLLDQPAYLSYLQEDSEVLTDKKKFFACSEEIRLSGVIEEACVLAIERSLVPHPGKMTPKQAWLFALSKVCSSITSGYFREFAYENIFKIVKLYPENYWDRFQEAVKNNLVKKFNEDNTNERTM